MIENAAEIYSKSKLDFTDGRQPGNVFNPSSPVSRNMRACWFFVTRSWQSGSCATKQEIPQDAFPKTVHFVPDGTVLGKITSHGMSPTGERISWKTIMKHTCAGQRNPNHPRFSGGIAFDYEGLPPDM